MELFIIFGIPILIIIYAAYKIKRDNEDEQCQSPKATTKNNTWYCHKCGTTNSYNNSQCVNCGFLHKKSNSHQTSALNYTPLSEKRMNSAHPIELKTEDKNSCESTQIERGNVSVQRVMFDDDVVFQTSDRYFSFDVETTGLNADSDRIIEIGAVLFEKGKPTKVFSSLVNPKIPVPASATVINHITNEMVMRAPAEEQVYPELIRFLENALNGETIICAHNASFDMKFLSKTFERLGYNANIIYIDTLSIARYMLPDLDNHKQITVAKHLGIANPNAHRAASDAEVCGYILSHFIEMKLIKIKEAEIKKAERAEARRIKEEEKRLRQETAQKAKEERERLRQLKEEEKQRKIIEKQNAENIPKKPIGRSVIQMDDDLHIIKQYDSVSEASRETGVNEKSIREVAKGRQKHAGGFVWKYADEYDNHDNDC